MTAAQPSSFPPLPNPAAEGEARYRTLADALADIIWTNNLAGEICTEQPGWGRFTGQTYEEYQGMGWAKAVHPDDAERTLAAWRQALSEERPFEFEHRLRRADGQWRHCRVRAVPVREGGQIVEWVGAHVDITGHKQAETALRESEARFRSVFENTVLPIFFWEGDFFTDANHAAIELLGFTREDYLQGRVNRRTLTPPGYEKLDQEMAEHLREQGVTPPYTKEYVRKDGQIIPIEKVSAALGSLPNRGVAFITDISGRRRSEERLRDALNAAQRASASKDEFLAKLSHELRTPLTPVLMAVSSLLEEEALEPALREDLALVKRNVELEARLIDDLLDVTRIVHGKLELKLQPCDLHGIIEHALGVVAPRLHSRRIEVFLGLSAPAVTIMGDPARLQQVFWNLLTNAAKFTPEGGRIEIKSVNPSDTHISVTIADTGVGIEPDRLGSLFNVFEQGDRSVTRRFGGLGLGLAICRGVVELHQGKITALSDGPGQGASFCVEFATSSVSPPTTSVPARPGHVEGPRPRLRILLVEDHESTGQILQRLLRRVGHQVDYAACVAKARQLAAESPHDLVISDLGLPDGNGLELMSGLRAAHGLTGIALSGYGTHDDIAASREAGFFAHMVKPVDWRQLADAIENWCQGEGAAWMARGDDVAKPTA